MNTKFTFIFVLLFFVLIHSCTNTVEIDTNENIIDIFYTQTNHQFPKDTCFSYAWASIIKNRIIKEFEPIRDKERINLIVEKCKFDSASNENNCETLVLSSTNGKYIGRIYHKKGVDIFEPIRGIGFYYGCHETRTYFCSKDSNKTNFRLLFSNQEYKCYFEIIHKCPKNKDQNLNNKCTDEMLSETVKKINDLFVKYKTKKE